MKPKPLIADYFGQALIDAGIISADEGVSRVVIDAKIGHIVRMYIERRGDERLLDLTMTLEGVKIEGVPAA